LRLELVADDRVCEQCRCEDMRRPANQRKFQNVPCTLLDNGMVVQGYQVPRSRESSRDRR
jgi:hypothetical protein